MKRLAVVVALAIAATLGSAGTASADMHEEQLCNGFLGNEIWQEANQIPAAGPVITHTVQGESPSDADTEHGAQQSCIDQHLAHILCGAADGIDEGIPELSDVAEGIRGANDGAAAITGHECAVETKCVDTNSCPKPDGEGDDDDDDSADAAVVAQNASAGGAMPRTGGELFAGAGLGLMSLGALVRRFLP